MFERLAGRLDPTRQEKRAPRPAASVSGSHGGAREMLTFSVLFSYAMRSLTSKRVHHLNPHRLSTAISVMIELKPLLRDPMQEGPEETLIIVPDREEGRRGRAWQAQERLVQPSLPPAAVFVAAESSELWRGDCVTSSITSGPPRRGCSQRALASIFSASLLEAARVPALGSARKNPE